MSAPRRAGRILVLSLVVALLCGPLAIAGGNGSLRAEFFSDMNLEVPAGTYEHSQIDFNWPAGTDPPGVGDTFSARWTGQIEPLYSETYKFPVTRDDAVRLWVDGELLINDSWATGNTGEVVSAPIDLEAGQRYDLKLEFVDGGLDAEVRLGWRSPSQPQEIVPASQLFGPRADGGVGEGGDDGKDGGDDRPTAPLMPRAPGPALDESDEPEQEPEPYAGRRVTVAPKRGKVLVRRPGSNRSVPLEELSSLPVGAIIDARRGTVRLSAEGKAGKEQSVAAWGAVFSVRQRRKGSRLVTFRLRHPGGLCEPKGRKPAAGAGSARRSENAGIARRRARARLWAKGKGRFRTRGRHGAATVRGTTWSVEDRCGTTVTRVRSGVVAVRDFARARTVLVRAGGRYVARAKRSGR